MEILIDLKCCYVRSNYYYNILILNDNNDNIIVRIQIIIATN